ncbi:MAG: aldo/keto reductase [Bradymonadaceae bacterium]
MESVSFRGGSAPALGFGTWQMTGDDCREGVEHALSLGYRHVDTAQVYENEREVGRALDNAAVDRDEVFLTTKVWRTNLERRSVLRSTEKSLERLGTDYVDLLLIHWPVPEVPVEETLDAMMELKRQGKTRFLGLSNFTPDQVEEGLDHAPVAANQVEYHPFLSQDGVLEVARDHDMMVTAYSPLARGRVADSEVLQEIGRHHAKAPAQVALRWLVQQENVAAIPKASSADHRRENLEIFDFELSGDEVDRIDDLRRGERLIDPGFAPEWEEGRVMNYE